MLTGTAAASLQAYQQECHHRLWFQLPVGPSCPVVLLWFSETWANRLEFLPQLLKEPGLCLHGKDKCELELSAQAYTTYIWWTFLREWYAAYLKGVGVNRKRALRSTLMSLQQCPLSPWSSCLGTRGRACELSGVTQWWWHPLHVDMLHTAFILPQPPQEFGLLTSRYPQTNPSLHLSSLSFWFPSN